MDQPDVAYLPSLTVTPNLVSATGFVYAIEIAFLGNCLSTMANLISFSIRTGTPVVYPNLMEHAGLFDFAGRANPYIFSPQGPWDGNEGGLASLRAFADTAMDGYFEGYMSRLRTIPPEWLSHLGLLSNATVFLGYRSDFSDWAVYEGTMARSAGRGNAIVLPGAYWWQYRTMPAEAADAVRQALPLGHQDQQQTRAARMADPNSGIRIGVHVRRGDYRHYRNGEYFWDLDVYVGMMRAISGLLGDQPHLFVLCSNDVWGADQLAGLPCCYEQGSTFDDFVALSRCDYLIGPPSTYANWASFLGRGKRIILTPGTLPQVNQEGLKVARTLISPIGSGVAGDYWAVEA